MRKVIVLMIIICIFSSVAFTQNMEENLRTNEESFLIIDNLIKKGLYKNYGIIEKEALNLTGAQKLTLYNMNEKNMGLPLALNILIGFGLGSTIQGDSVGGWIGLLGDTVGLTFLFVGVIQSIKYNAVKLNTYTMTVEREGDKDGIAMMTVSGVILGISRIFQIIKPPTYTVRYNNDLRQALNKEVLSIAPIFDFNENGSFVMAVNIKY